MKRVLMLFMVFGGLFLILAANSTQCEEMAILQEVAKTSAVATDQECLSIAKRDDAMTTIETQACLKKMVSAAPGDIMAAIVSNMKSATARKIQRMISVSKYPYSGGHPIYC